ncbi:unnamed protein product [Rangifer tarandus platyrhynchus]|uniref:Uncharacterized protein n=1 Tax=Rangifer tarandus platyrhynchus TaxID=3082113 RepID=A0ABN8Y283_RANTA|nr:unnamed protein product [Rangifer tarandus platyrhynchus]
MLGGASSDAGLGSEAGGMSDARLGSDAGGGPVAGRVSDVVVWSDAGGGPDAGEECLMLWASLMMVGSLHPDVHRVVIVNLHEKKKNLYEKSFFHTFLTTFVCSFFLKHNCCAISV